MVFRLNTWLENVRKSLNRERMNEMEIFHPRNGNLRGFNSGVEGERTLIEQKKFFLYFDILFQKLYILYMCLFEYFSGIFCHCLMMSNILGDGLKCAKCEIDCDERVGRWWGRWLLITDRASWNRISWHDSHWTFPRIRWAMMSVC